MFGLVKKIFIGLLIGLVNGSDHANCVSLSNQKCMTHPTLINSILMKLVKNFTIIHLPLS